MIYLASDPISPHSHQWLQTCRYLPSKGLLGCVCNRGPKSLPVFNKNKIIYEFSWEKLEAA